MARKIYTRAHPVHDPFGTSRPEPAPSRAVSPCAALWLPAAAPWAATVESELLKFPAGAHDDIVDTLSLIGRMIAGLETGTTPSPLGQEMGPGQITLDKLVELERARRPW